MIKPFLLIFDFIEIGVHCCIGTQCLYYAAFYLQITVSAILFINSTPFMLQLRFTTSRS